MMMDMFTSARVRLTFLYLLIVVAISSSISALVYLRIVSVLDANYARIEQRINEEWPQFGPESAPGKTLKRIRLEDLENAKELIAKQLFAINLIIAVIFTVAGYFFSGKTLEPIEEVHEEQKRFIGDAAHELKTPITALKTSLEVNLMDKSLSKETRQILHENLEDVVCLESLSQSLLRLAKVTDQEMVQEIVDFRKVVIKAVDYMQASAKKRGIKLQVHPGRKKQPVIGDEGALFDLVLIFLENALKYSDDKSKVEVKLKSKRNSVELQVTDYGLGIAKEDLAHIFDRFYRADQVRTGQGRQGYGLGLSVAQKIVDQHNGKISVDSKPKSGSTFTVSLPKKG